MFLFQCGIGCLRQRAKLGFHGYKVWNAHDGGRFPSFSSIGRDEQAVNVVGRVGSGVAPAVLDRMGDTQIACHRHFVVGKAHVAGGEAVSPQPVERQCAAAAGPGGDDRDVFGAEEVDQRRDELLRAFRGQKLARRSVRAIDPFADLEGNVQPGRIDEGVIRQVESVLRYWRRELVGAGVRSGRRQDRARCGLWCSCRSTPKVVTKPKEVERDQLLWVLLLEEELAELEDATPNVPMKTATVAQRVMVSISPPEVNLNRIDVPGVRTRFQKRHNASYQSGGGIGKGVEIDESTCHVRLVRTGLKNPVLRMRSP